VLGDFAGTPKTIEHAGRQPASAKQRTSSTQEPGVSSEALMMSEQPAARAPPILRAGVSVGKFHGVKAATMPTGSCTTICRILPRPGTTRP
jgi:hypothetical protein